MNSCVTSPEDGPIGPKHVEIRRYMNKIEIVTSVGFSFHKITVIQKYHTEGPLLRDPYIFVCPKKKCDTLNVIIKTHDRDLI